MNSFTDFLFHIINEIKQSRKQNVHMLFRGTDGLRPYTRDIIACNIKEPQQRYRLGTVGNRSFWDLN